MANLFPGAKLMQVIEWGYPMGSTRPVPPSGKAFSVIHITGNSRLPSAESEASWRINDPGLQNSMTFCVNRDGSVVQLLADPLHMAPWSNGDVNQPDTSNRRIAATLADGVNFNEYTLVSIENVGYEPGYPLTEAQKKTCAKIIAYYHKAAGVAISRSTVIGHYQINSVTRPNCPQRDKGVIDEIVAQARIEAGIDPVAEDPQVIEELKAKIAELEESNRRKWQRILALITKRDSLIAEIGTLEEELEAALDQAATAAELRIRVRRLRNRIEDIKAKVATLAADIADD